MSAITYAQTCTNDSYGSGFSAMGGKFADSTYYGQTLNEVKVTIYATSETSATFGILIHDLTAGTDTYFSTTQTATLTSTPAEFTFTDSTGVTCPSNNYYIAVYYSGTASGFRTAYSACPPTATNVILVGKSISSGSWSEFTTEYPVMSCTWNSSTPTTSQVFIPPPPAQVSL